jgi:RHS repeat-associated protein
VELSWNAPAGTLPAIYQLSRRPVGGEWKLLEAVQGTSYVDAAAPPATAVEYSVAAVDSEGIVGSPSPPVSIYIQSVEFATQQVGFRSMAPSELKVYASHGHAALVWDRTAEADGYLIERQLQAGGPFSVVGAVATEGFIDRSAVSAGLVGYRVVPLDGSSAGSPSEVATALIIPSLPAAPKPRFDPALAAPVPADLNATANGNSVQLSWKAGLGSTASTSYAVYRFSPATGAFNLAVAGLATPSFADVALPPAAGYGYVVTATSASGAESSFSLPTWVNVGGGGPPDLALYAPAVIDTSSDAVRLLALFEVAAGLDKVSFQMAPASGGPWIELPAQPANPSLPVPYPLVGTAASVLWTSTLHTSPLVPGPYTLRVQLTDQAGRVQEQVQNLLLTPSAARGPPEFALTVSNPAKRVHLTWNQNAASYIVQRSIFGPDGPFEAVARIQSQEYDDDSALAGQPYSYRVLGVGSSAGSSSAATLITSTLRPAVGAGQPMIQLGAVSQSELAITVSALSEAHPLGADLTAFGSAYKVDAVSLATAQLVHHLAEAAQITLDLPAGTSSADAASTSIYHWNESTASWVREASSPTADQSAITAPIDHLSDFVLAGPALAASGGTPAQMPAPSLDSSGTSTAKAGRPSATGGPLALGPPGPEIVSMRSPNSSFFKNADGSIREIISSGLVNFRDATGTWQRIDTTLAPVGSSSNYVHNNAGPIQVQLPADLSMAPIQVSSSAGTLTFSITGALSNSRTVNGSAAHYQGVLAGVDANYSVIPEGLKEELAIGSLPPQGAAFSFDISTGSLILQALAGGAIHAVDAAGNVQFTIHSPFMHDAPTAQSELGNTSDRVAVSLTGGSGTYHLTYTPDSAWLNDPARLYPVTIDPTLTYNVGSGGESDAQINDCFPSANYNGYTYLPIGYTPYTAPSSCNGKSRAMIYFSAPINAPVASSAQLSLWQYTNYRNGGKVIQAVPATNTSWSASSVNWINAPSGTCTYGCPSATTLNGNGWVNWDVTAPIRAWEQQAFAYNGFEMSGDESGCCTQEQFYAGPYTDTTKRPQLTITFAGEESGTIAWQGAPQVVTAIAGSLISIPIKITNTTGLVGGSLTWRAYNHSDLVRVGIRDYRNAAGALVQLSNQPNLRTYLPADVANVGSTTLNAVIQVPGDPGDYLLRLDLVHEVTGAAPVWFADRGNQPLEVRTRVLAPGDDKTTHVPVALGDGSSLGINTSNGFATLSATDFSIAERAAASLHLGRTYNGVNGLLSATGITGTAATNSTYGLGWTFDFQRSLHLGSLGANTYDPNSGILTDGQGRAWTLTWNAGRGLFEDAAGNRTITPAAAQVVAASSTISVPVRPVDLINGSGSIVADAGAPGGYALRLEGTSGPPTSLIMPSGLVPTQQNGSIEFWFKPNFDMSVDAACHVFFSDSQLRFGLAWNCNNVSYSWGSSTSRAVDFFAYDGDTTTYRILSSLAVTWASGSWHHLTITWAEGGVMQLMTDTNLYTSVNHFQSPITDLIFGYQPSVNNGALNYLNGRIAQLRVDGRVVPGNGTSGELSLDAAAGAILTSTANTLYLGRYDAGSPQSSSATYVLRNADQSTENYSSYGLLQSEADRLGNQIDYSYDSSGRIQTISDHSIAGRTIGFTYNTNSFVATDLAGRTVTYQLNGSGDLVSVTRSNQVPNPLTGISTPQNTVTSYSYVAGHLIQQVTDPMGAKTTVNYDQSYRQVVLIDNPAAYWRLGDIAGTTATDSASTHAGTLHGTITLGQGGAAWNDSDYAEKFDGTSGYISASIAAIAAGAAYTVEAWAKQASSTGSQVVVSFSQGASTGMLWLNAGLPTFRIGTASLFTEFAAATAISAGWHHLVATYDGVSARLYVDGQLAAGPTAVSSASTSTTLWIASQGGTTSFFNGTLDEVALYSQALSMTRVQTHFVAGRLGVGASIAGYAATVIFDAPSGYWRLGDSGGPQASDQSTYANPASYNGGATLSQSGALSTDPATSVSLDGTGGYVSVPDNATYYGSAQLTVEAWVKAAAWVANASMVNRRTAGNVGGFTMEVANTSGQIALSAYVGSTWYSVTTPSNLTVGVWHHLAGTYDGANLRLYADGILAASTAIAGSLNSPGGPTFLLGKNVTGAYYFNGSIQEAALYPVALLAARILAHYNAGRASLLGQSQYAGTVLNDLPIGYWRLGETSGSTAADSTGSAYSGTYVGGVSLGQGGGIANDSDHATRFDGSSAYVSLGDPAGMQLGTGTLEAWVNTKTTAQSAIGAKFNAWWLGVQSNGNLGFYDPTAAAMRDSGVVINDGYWHHVAAVFQSGVSGGSQMYVDGKPAGLAFLMTVVNQSSEVEIGAYAAGQFFNGTIDEAAIYFTSLSAARIAAHYQASRVAIAASGRNSGSYAANVGADRPSAYWRIGEPAGTTTVTDRSGNNNAGTTGGAGITLGQTGALVTDSNSAARFDGSTTAYVSVPYSITDNPSGAFSLEAWVDVTGGQGTWRAVVSTACTSCSGYKGFEIYARSDNAWSAYIGTGSASWGYVAGGSVILNQWTHVVETYNGSVLSLYVNGALIGTTSSAFAANSTLPLYLGTDVTGSSRAYFLTGIVDDVAVYPVALTRARIQAHYNAAWDFSTQRVATVQDPRGTTIASLTYNDDTAVTQVIDGRGLASFYTFQQYGGRTMSVTDTGNNVTRYEFDGGAAYLLIATVSPAGIRRSRLVNSGALVGQQGQALIQDESLQPSTTHLTLMGGGYPDPALFGSTSLFTSGEAWIWDSTLAVQPGAPSHRSTPAPGQHDHDVEFSKGIPVPYGATLSQWVFIEAGAKPPSELALQFYDGSSWAHRAYWGYNASVVWGSSCPANCGLGAMPTSWPPVPVPGPVPGRWVLLTVDLGAVDMANRLLTGIAFTLFDGTGAVWWGPTTLELPGSSVSDPTRTISRFAYNATNDVVASVDPNGIAAISDIDASGLTRLASTGVEPAAPISLLQDTVSALGSTCPSIPAFPSTSWAQESCYSGTSAGTSSTQHGGKGSLTQTHTGGGLQSALFRDVTGMTPGTYVQVSVWVQTSAGATGVGGAGLRVENQMLAPLTAQRSSASIQTAGQWAQLTLPFVIDTSGQLRIHLVQQNLQGTTTWADLHIDDLTPAPDVTLQHPLAMYTYGFELAGDTSWSLGSTPATILLDTSQAHGSQYSVKDSLAASNTSNTVSHTVTLTGVNASYRVTAWARTVASGSHGGVGGAQLCVASPGVNCTSAAVTEGQWQLFQEVVGTGGFTSLIVQLVHANFQGDVYWDDVNVERLADSTPAGTGIWQGTSWTGTYTGSAMATWASSWTGGFGSGPSRQVTVTSAGALTDIRDALPTTVLRKGASYVISVWASSTSANTTIDFSLRDSNFASLGMDQSTTCALQTTPTLCQNSLTYTRDPGTNNLVVYYGGQGARTVSISLPQVALQSTQTDYTSAGLPNHIFDIFGHSTATTYDSNGLYPTQNVVTATPSPSVTTNFTYNSLGQLILSTRVNGGQSIADQFWLDSWGRQVGLVRNCVAAVTPPSLCNAAADSSTNVLTRSVFDLNGNLVDRFDQAQVSGSWIDTHYLYDPNNNLVAQVQNCVTASTPCDGTSNSAQNVVTAFAYNANNQRIDTYAAMPGCTSSCVPASVCAAGPPPSCASPSTACSTATCVDEHAGYDLTGRVFVRMANFNGLGDVSQANVTTQYVYDADGRVTDVLAPITNASLQSGQIDGHRAYDALGRLVSDIAAYAVPSWMTSTTRAQTDYVLDLAGRVVSVKSPDVGTATFNANRVVTNTVFDDLNRVVSVTADATGMNATTTTVYDPRGHVHSWSPPTLRQPANLETTQNSDFAGRVISVVRDDVSGGLLLTTSTAYDGYGRATDVTDPRGIVTHTISDAIDRVTSTTQNYCPVGNSNSNCTGSSTLPDQNVTTSYAYDLAGNRTQVVNPRSIVQYTAYDALHRDTSVTQSCQTVPTPPSTSCGTQTSDQNVLSSQTMDQVGDVLTTTDPLNRVKAYAYDALGRKISQTINCVGSGGLCNGGVTSGQNLTTLWQYDAHGDVLKESSPRQCTAAAPCYQGNGTSFTDGANLATGYTYDGLYRLASVIEDQVHLVQLTSYTYDPSGNRLSQTDGRGSGHTTSYTIDNLGRTTKVTDANNYAVQVTYNLASEVVSTVNGRGKTNTNTLDRVGRLAGVSYLKADGTTPLSRSFLYDADGNMTSFADTDVVQTTVTYDHLNRPSTVTAPSPYGTTTYAYFMDGVVNTIADANGTTTFTEDRLGRVASMVTPLIAGTTSYTYDVAGRLTSRTEANGIVTTVTYTGADQLASKTEVAGSTTLASWTNVTYDLAQNRTAETLTYYAANPYPDAQAGTATYQYDTENQLSQAALPGRTAGAFGFDAAHNLTSNAGSAQTYNANESLQTVGGATTGSDADGNQVSDGNGHSLSWNSLSQLEAFATAETYAYDGLGRLTTVTNGTNVTKLVYQGISGKLIQELNSSNVLIRGYSWDASRQLYFKTGSSSYYQITNPHGDVIASASATALAGTIHFDPWGNPTYTPTGTTTPFGFQGAAGSWTDSATSFVSMGIRWYYPKVSEFLSSDPAAGTADARVPIERMRWLYGADAPLTHDDPTGLIQTMVTDGGCDQVCQAGNAASSVGVGSSNQHAAPAQIVYYGRGTPAYVGQPNGCNLGSQTCGVYAGHVGRQLLNVGCALTICPLAETLHEAYKLETDPFGWSKDQVGWWNDQADNWNADKSYWSDQFNTIDRLSPALRSGQKCLDCGLALFTLKWSGDRIDDFQKDPGTASANILVFFVSLAIPGPKVLSRDASITIRVRPSVDTATFTSGERTANGGIRNRTQFWKQWADRYPDTLSDSNKDLIRTGRSPRVNADWTSVYPEDQPYLDDVLEHHHIDQGRWATPLPATVHHEWSSDLHSRRGGVQAI